MSDELKPPQDLLAEIEAMQDDVLRRLDDLNTRIERTLAEFGVVFPKAEASPNSVAENPASPDRRAA